MFLSGGLKGTKVQVPSDDSYGWGIRVSLDFWPEGQRNED